MRVALLEVAVSSEPQVMAGANPVGTATWPESLEQGSVSGGTGSFLSFKLN